MWNNLPAEAVEAKSVNEFKNALSRIKNAGVGFFMDESLPKPHGRAGLDSLLWCSRTR